ncbi:MAG: ribonuclease P protein component [Candidatus Fermentibacteraceae bacterium]|nr:ribonuclease P protein component [Candidatus Fermentibacteraceae bacterium]
MKNTLRKGYQFRKILRSGSAFRGTSFRAVYRLNSLGIIRLGFSLSAKSGNAVKRNLIRRRLRQLSREKGADTGADVVILPEGKLLKNNWESIRRDFMKLLVEIEGTRKNSQIRKSNEVTDQLEKKHQPE